MSEVKNGNGKILWATIGSVVVFIMLMVALFGFFVTPLTARTERLEKENAEKAKVIDENKTRITKLESAVEYYEKDTDDDNKKIVARLEKLESQQSIIIGNSNRLLQLLTKKQKEEILNE